MHNDAPFIAGGSNVALKVPKYRYAETFAFYRETLGLPYLGPMGSSERFRLGPVTLWLDEVAHQSQTDIWLELRTPEPSTAAQWLVDRRVPVRDELEPLDEGLGHWISDPAGVVYLLSRLAEDADHAEAAERHRSLFWKSASGEGLEHLRLTIEAGGVEAAGTILVAGEEQALSCNYTIHCDPGWQFRRLEIETGTKRLRRLVLETDGAGRWWDGLGHGHPELAGCMEVDVSATPFTNSLPVRRLDLPAGDSATLAVAEVDAASLGLQATPQRYSCLQRDAEGRSRWRYENLASDFSADLELDTDGIVVDYPGEFRRI